MFDDIHFRFRPYFPYVAYAQSKTANALFAVEANRRWAADGVTANAAMPGYILTNLQQNDSAEALAGMTRIRVPEPKTIEQGAATSVLLATSPLLDGTGGRYFEDGNEAEVVHDSSGWIGVRTHSGAALWASVETEACRLATRRPLRLRRGAVRHRLRQLPAGGRRLAHAKGPLRRQRT